MKSSPDLFNFYEVLAAHDMVTDAGRATTFRRIIKAPWFQKEITKNEGLSENMGLTGKQFKDFRRKKKTFLAQTKQLREKHEKHGPLMQQMKMELVTSKNSTQQNLKRKEIRSKLLNFARLELWNQALTCSTFT